MDAYKINEQEWPHCKFCYKDLEEDMTEVPGNLQYTMSTGLLVCPKCGLVYKKLKKEEVQT